MRICEVRRKSLSFIISRQVAAHPGHRDLPAENVPGNSGQEAIPEDAGCKVREFEYQLLSKVLLYLQDDMGQVPQVQDEDLH